MATLQETSKAATRELRVLAWSALFRQLTGSPPIVTSYPEYTQIAFTGDQQGKLQAEIEKIIAREPGDVRVDIMPVITPIMLKRVIVYMAIAGAAGWFAGRYLGRSR